MRIAIFSDIHANLPALEAVWADIKAKAPDAIYCLGDLVGYATFPNEVVQFVRARHIPTIAGNYDFGVGATSDDCGCAYKTEADQQRGAESIAYTNGAVTDDTRAYLARLPKHLRVVHSSGEVLMVHGSPRKINEYLFEDRPDSSLLRIMEPERADVMLFGHTHKPYHRVMVSEVEGQPRYRHAINTGSVGKPKDGDPRACYVLLTLTGAPIATHPNAVQVEFVRLPYDIEKTATLIEASVLPNEFADMVRNAY
jgi:putative phosphoesterase